MRKYNVLVALFLVGHSACVSSQMLTAENVAKQLDAETFKLKDASLGKSFYLDTKEARSIVMELADQLKVAKNPSMEYLTSVQSYAKVIEEVNMGRVQVDRGEFAKALTADLEMKVIANDLDIESRSVAKIIPVSFIVIKGGQELHGLRVTCQPDLFDLINSLLNLTSAFAGKDGTEARITPGKYTFKVYQADQLIFISRNNQVSSDMKQPITINF